MWKQGVHNIPKFQIKAQVVSLILTTHRTKMSQKYIIDENTEIKISFSITEITQILKKTVYKCYY